MTSAIVVNQVSKKFRLPHHKKSTILQNVVGLFKRQMTYEEFWALRDVSFNVEHGEVFGIIGRNGSGKSTLLKILAQVLYPDNGTVRINGKIASFLELGVGFQQELTAAENIYIYASILGMSRKETRVVYDQILEFAELKKFEDMKLKNFSSGMYARLAFSTAITCNPDIMLIDEVLSVGDESFQKKCMRKINEFKEQGKTIIYVSHSLNTVEALCDRAILLDNGQIVSEGTVEDITSTYLTGIGGPNNFGSYKKPHTENELIIGTEQNPLIDSVSACNYFVLSRYRATRSGVIKELQIKCANKGNVKAAVYEDLNGEPGVLINSSGPETPVAPGWNCISFPSTQIQAQKHYWLAFCSDVQLMGAKSTRQFSRRFRKVEYARFEFPDFAGSEFTCDSLNFDILSGYGKTIE